mgnify:CR=1 FL=1
MDAQMLKIISYFCFGFAVLFLLIAVILFFRFRVRELVAKLSGKQEAQQIREKIDRMHRMNLFKLQLMPSFPYEPEE